MDYVNWRPGGVGQDVAPSQLRPGGAHRYCSCVKEREEPDWLYEEMRMKENTRREQANQGFGGLRV